MKFSVWDYSQVKIAQFNQQNPQLAIDPTDIFIFTWFKGFANKTRAKTSKKDGSQAKGMWCKTIDGVDYFNVRYDAIIRDFPILGVCNVKSIQRRFDKYVEAGIFEKTIVHAGKKGNFTYFAFTELFLSFEYDNDNPEHKEQIKEENEAQKAQPKTVSVDKNVQTKTVSVDKNVQTKTVGVDKNVQTKTVGVDKNVQTKTVGVDKNVQTLIYNPSISLNNPSTTSSNPDKTNGTKSYFDSNKKEEEDFSNTLIKLFGYEPHFSPDPMPQIKKIMDSVNISGRFLGEYCQWLYSKLKPKCKNPANFISYFYKSCTAEVYISEFAYVKQQKIKKQEEKLKNQITCPVCGRVHDKNEFYCPNEECCFPAEELENPSEIAKQKCLYNLRKNDSAKFDEYQQLLLLLNDEYPIFTRISNKEKFAEYKEKVKELDCKFLNIKITA